MKPRQSALRLDEWDQLEVPEAETRKADGPEELFATQCRAYQLPPFECQLEFAKAAIGRRWRFDFAWREHKIAVEIEGLVMRRLAGQLVVMGRHASPKGIADDMEKYNTAALLGWFVLRFRQADVKPRRAIKVTMQALEQRGWQHAASSD